MTITCIWETKAQKAENRGKTLHFKAVCPFGLGQKPHRWGGQFPRAGISEIEKVVRIHAGLLQDSAERSFGQVTGMIRDRRIATSTGVVPDLMTTGSLPIKLESTSSELSCDFTITKAGKPAHLIGHHDGEVAPPGGCGKRDVTFSLAACLNKFSSDVARDFKGLRNRPPLRHQTRQFVRSRQINSFRQRLNLDANGEFHVTRNSTRARGRRFRLVLSLQWSFR